MRGYTIEVKQGNKTHYIGPCGSWVLNIVNAMKWETLHGVNKYYNNPKKRINTLINAVNNAAINPHGPITATIIEVVWEATIIL